MSNLFLSLPEEILGLILTPWCIDYKLVCTQWMGLSRALRRIKWFKKQLYKALTSGPFAVSAYTALKLKCYIWRKNRLCYPFNVRLYSTNIRLMNDVGLSKMGNEKGQELFYKTNPGTLDSEVIIKYKALYLIMIVHNWSLVVLQDLLKLVCDSLL